MLGALVLVAFVKLLFATDSSRFCAGVYTVLAAIDEIIRIVAGDVHVVVGGLGVVFAGAWSWAYFSVLHRVDPWTEAWWAVAIGGSILAGLIGACVG